MLRRNSNFILLSIVLDVAATLLAAKLAYLLRGALPFGITWVSYTPIELFALLAVGTYMTTFLAAEVYNPDRTFRVVDELQTLVLAGAFACLALAGLIYFTQLGLSRLLVVYFYIISFGLLVSWRLGARLLLRLRNGRAKAGMRRVLLIGSGPAAERTADRLLELAWTGLEVVGCLAEDPSRSSVPSRIPVVGAYDRARQVIEAQGVDEVIIALPAESYARLEALVGQLIELPCNVWIAPDYFSLLLYGSQVENLGGVPMISLKVPTLTGYQRLLKRASDLVLAAVLTAVGLPLIALIALAIKLDSPGPVLFSQHRVGENGRLFWMLKFRTMYQNAEQRLAEVLQWDEHGHLIHKSPDDPRVTRVGRFLRRTSLDELPQLFNVLKGEMSLVGPRPELPWLVERYEPWQRKRFAVPQGITGWWQVNGRSDKPMHLHTEEDLLYVSNYSLLLDLKILLKTVFVVLRGRGAY